MWQRLVWLPWHIINTPSFQSSSAQVAQLSSTLVYTSCITNEYCTELQFNTIICTCCHNKWIVHEFHPSIAHASCIMQMNIWIGSHPHLHSELCTQSWPWCATKQETLTTPNLCRQSHSPLGICALQLTEVPSLYLSCNYCWIGREISRHQSTF